MPPGSDTVMVRREMARVVTATLDGLYGQRVHVEVDLAPSLPGFTLVGLPSTALRESRDRVGSALRHAGFAWPDRRITVSLAPADVRKDGAAMDLAIATGILLASGQIRRPASDLLRRALVLGELALDGMVRPVPAAIALGMDAARLGVDRLVVPGVQVATLRGELALPCVGVARLSDLPRALEKLERAVAAPRRRCVPAPRAAPELHLVRGQARAKRALILAAAGRHHLLLSGPPGCGKSMLARQAAALLPSLDDEARRDRLRIHAAAGIALDPGVAVTPPLRAPHHSVSAAGLLGGGRPLRPGEVTLAHGGILLLDEVAEFGSRALEMLREPLSSARVEHSRLGTALSFPAGFLLVATTNPCPCGYRGSRVRTCICREHQIARYLRRLSGPLRDRIDLWVDMDREPAELLVSAAAPGPDPRPAIARVRSDGPLPDGAHTVEALPDALRSLMVEWADRLGLSARAVVRAVAVARTIARLAGRDEVGRADLAEALSYRSPD